LSNGQSIHDLVASLFAKQLPSIPKPVLCQVWKCTKSQLSRVKKAISRLHLVWVYWRLASTKSVRRVPLHYLAAGQRHHALLVPRTV